MLEENPLETGAIADNDILRAENRTCEVTAIGTTEYFDEIFMTLENAIHLMDQLDAFHKTLGRISNRHVTPNTNSKLQAKTKTAFGWSKTGRIKQGRS
jgi:hypothetical protein